MILTDREIRNSLAFGLIVIDPLPAVDAYDSTSVDLTLDPTLREFKPPTHGLTVAIDPGRPGYKAKQLLDQITEAVVIPPNGYDLEPSRLILGWTRERVELKKYGRVAARVEGKSSLGRVGLAVHITAPTIHAGFQGTIQLEIINHGPTPIKLRSGLPICQLILEQTLGMPENAYEGQFFGQSAT
jgi:dCTP deaminase